MATTLLVLALAIPTLAQTEGAPRARYSARDFGAIPDSPDDAGPAIRSAIAAAIASGGPAEVVLEAGVYRLAAGPGGACCLAISGATDLVLRGVGPETRLLVTDPKAGAVDLSASKRVGLRDLTIDYDPLPFLQGTVRAIDLGAGSFDLEVAEGYPTPDAPNFVGAAEPYGKWGMIIDPATRRIRSGTPDHYMTPKWSHVQGRVYRFQTTAEHYRLGLAHMRIGDSYVHLARGYGSAVFAQGCEGVRIEGVRIHASPGLAVGLVANRDEALVRGLEVVFPEGSDRLLTTNADGVHCQQNRVGPAIEDCIFEGMADDAVNIYTPPNVLREIRSSREWLVSPAVWPLVGDVLQVFDPIGGRVRGTVTIESVAPEGGSLLLGLREPLEGAAAGADHRSGDTLYNLNACGAGCRIVGNVMRGNRRYGCMLRSGEGLVEGNLFEDCTGAGVAILNEPDWPEGPVPWAITVRGNRFVRGGTCLGYADTPQGAALSVRAVRLGFSLAEGRPVSGVLLEDNEFVDCLGVALFAGATEGLIVRGNRFHAGAEAPLLRETGVIVLGDSIGARLVGNTVEDPRAGITAAVTILPDVAPGAEGVAVTDLRAQLRDGAPAVDDRRAR